MHKRGACGGRQIIEVCLRAGFSRCCYGDGSLRLQGLVNPSETSSASKKENGDQKQVGSRGALPGDIPGDLPNAVDTGVVQVQSGSCDGWSSSHVGESVVVACLGRRCALDISGLGCKSIDNRRGIPHKATENFTFYARHEDAKFFLLGGFRIGSGTCPYILNKVCHAFVGTLRPCSRKVLWPLPMDVVDKCPLQFGGAEFPRSKASFVFLKRVPRSAF